MNFQTFSQVAFAFRVTPAAARDWACSTRCSWGWSAGSSRPSARRGCRFRRRCGSCSPRPPAPSSVEGWQDLDDRCHLCHSTRGRRVRHTNGTPWPRGRSSTSSCSARCGARRSCSCAWRRPAFGPVPLIFVRVTIAALAPAAADAAPPRPGAGAGRGRPLALVGAISTAIPFTLFAFAALTLPAGLSSVLNASVPLFGGLIGFLWLGQRPTRPARARPRRRIRAACSCWPGRASRAPATGARVVAALVATVLYAPRAHLTPRVAHGRAAARGRRRQHDRRVGDAAAARRRDLAGLLPAASAWIGTRRLLGVGCTALAFVLYFRLLARAGPATAMAVTYSHPRLRRDLGRAAARRTPARRAPCSARCSCWPAWPSPRGRRQRRDTLR